MAVAGAVKKKHRSIVISRGTLKVECSFPIASIYPVAEKVFFEARFKKIGGTHDALSGALTAWNNKNERVTVKLTLVKKNLTAMEILIGEGNVKQSKYLHDEIVAKLTAAKGKSDR